jgi:hypothetical protein
MNYLKKIHAFFFAGFYARDLKILLKNNPLLMLILTALVAFVGCASSLKAKCLLDCTAELVASPYFPLAASTATLKHHKLRKRSGSIVPVTSRDDYEVSPVIQTVRSTTQINVFYSGGNNTRNLHCCSTPRSR